MRNQTQKLRKTVANVTFHEFIKDHLDDFVEVNTYLTKSKLYGVIADYDNISLTLSVTYLDKEKKDAIGGKNDTRKEMLYIPVSSIKSIKKL